MQVSDPMHRQARALADPSRFRLFRYIAESEHAVDVAELTELLGFNHNAIRQHLAVLVEAELITTFDEVRTVRGRPRKLYRLRADALSAFRSISASYERLAGLLLTIADTGGQPTQVGFRAGLERAAAVDTPGDDDRQPDPVDRLARQLAVDGFEPRRVDERTVALDNCPFADVAVRNPDIVCAIHQGLIDGYIAAQDPDRHGTLEARDPFEAGCLVRVEPGPSSTVSD